MLIHKPVLLTLLWLLLLTFPELHRSQTRRGLNSVDLAKMDVLSRAGLFEKMILDAALKEGVDPLILWTIAYNETRFRPWLTSSKNAQGLMQFMPATARRFGLSDPYNAALSITAAARYIRYLDRLFSGRLDSVLAAYNAGEGTVLAYLAGKAIRSNGRTINPFGKQTPSGVPPYKETTEYVAKGRRIYSWLTSQSKFNGAIKKSAVAATVLSNVVTKQYITKKAALRADGEVVATPATTIVQYDPRTGNRFQVLRNAVSPNGVKKLNQSGPVIISPDARIQSTPKARSTQITGSAISVIQSTNNSSLIKRLEDP